MTRAANIDPLSRADFHRSLIRRFDRSRGGGGGGTKQVDSFFFTPARYREIGGESRNWILERKIRETSLHVSYFPTRFLELNLSSLYPQRWRNNSKTVIQGLWVYSIRQLEEEEEEEEEQFLQTRDCELLILSYFVAFKKIISNETWLIDTRVGYFYRLSRSREKLRDSVGDRNTVNDIDAVWTAR